MEGQQVPPQAAILHIIANYWLSRTVCVAAGLKLADAVGDGKTSLSAIASATSAKVDALRRLMRALTSHGFFHEEADGTFTQTPLSDVLRSGRPASMRAVA